MSTGQHKLTYLLFYFQPKPICLDKEPDGHEIASGLTIFLKTSSTIVWREKGLF